MTPRLQRTLEHAGLPAAVFSIVLIGHYLWLAFFGPHVGWASLVDGATISNFRLYIEGQNYGLGLSYALSLGFAAVVLRRYREERFCRARTLTAGGVTLSGFLAVASCYVVGCCGSPMLSVYLSLDRKSVV